MQLSLLLAMAFGLAPTWAVPVIEPRAGLDKSPAAISPAAFRLPGGPLKVLKPKPLKPGKVDFGLKKNIVLDWDDDDKVTKAKLNANWKDQDDVKVINMADFGTALEKVDCTAPSMALDFKEAGPYKEAKASWAWVDGAAKNNIILFVNHPSCGADKAETPFKVTSIKYDDVKFIATMQVTAIDDLESVIPDGDLTIETLADIQEPIIDARDYEEGDAQELDKRISGSLNPSISLNRNFDNKNILNIGSSSNFVRLDCTDCGTRGKINVKLYAKISWFSVKTSYVEFRAQDVQAWLNLKLQGKGTRTHKGHKVIVPITAYGFSIPKIATLRIAADIGVGWDASVSGEGQITFGATAKLTNPSVWKECFRGCDDTKSGWQITTTPHNPTGKGTLKATLGAHAYITPKAEARIFKSGYEVGVALLAPKFQGSAAMKASSTGGVCAKPKAILGVDVDVKVGLEAYVYAGPNYQSPNWRKTLYANMWTLYDKCFVLQSKP
ncbi:hypothetical protein QBC35DRAFT_473426 [Podospora australis]|uniref:Uncharacterized protein n=1 Tax=Podospora australis TaxID=1536484 RepID=A0AAN6WWG7_9PEZI|nr:hypothetical protein QBC35DRAFT_473426 [Podospora australis]